MARTTTNTMAHVEPKTEVTEVKKPKKKFNQSDYILCHSVTAGGLNITCKSGSYYQFKGYGAECDIEYRDLVALIRTRSSHIFEPRLIIDDEDFLEEFPQVKDVYNTMFSNGDLNDILELSVEQMKDAISLLPDGVFASIRTLAATKVADGTIDSVRKIRALSDVFGSDFNFLSELFNK